MRAGLTPAGCWHRPAICLFEAASLAAPTAQGCDLQGTSCALGRKAGEETGKSLSGSRLLLLLHEAGIHVLAAGDFRW